MGHCICKDGLTQVLDAIREADGLIMTSNAPDNMYMGLMKNYQQTLSRFVGPTEFFCQRGHAATQGLQQNGLAVDAVRSGS